MDEQDDRIERSIEIAAPAQQVWELVSEPGWWINDGQVVEHRIERDGDTSTVRDPVHGVFTIHTVILEPPHHAAFRWWSTPSHEAIGNAESTLVEFWLEERSPSGVVLRVVESGFVTLGLSARQRRAALDEHALGWETELAAAHAHMTPAQPVEE